MIYDANTYWGR